MTHLSLSRHGLGALIGVIATPLIGGCFVYGADKVRLSIAHAVSDVPAGDSAGTDWGAAAVPLARTPRGGSCADTGRAP